MVQVNGVGRIGDVIPMVERGRDGICSESRDNGAGRRCSRERVCKGPGTKSPGTRTKVALDRKSVSGREHFSISASSKGSVGELSERGGFTEMPGFAAIQPELWQKRKTERKYSRRVRAELATLRRTSSFRNSRISSTGHVSMSRSSTMKSACFFGSSEPMRSSLKSR